MTRALLIESGHRCAVCGAGCALEKAHIIPWHESGEHNFEDLICLCATCHSRADSEHWGEKTLRQYKKSPWIMRQKSESQRISSPVMLQLILDLDIDEFDETYQRLLEFALAAFLNISPDAVKITSIKPGNSVNIIVRLPSEPANRLLAAYHEGNPHLMDYLSPFHLLKITSSTELEDSLRTTQNVAIKRKQSKNRHLADRLVSLKEASKILHVAPVTIRRWAREGIIPAIKV